MRRSIALLFACLARPAVAGSPLPADPLYSPVLEGLGALYFEGAPVQFDPHLKIDFPEIAENQRSLPVSIDARGRSIADRHRFRWNR